MSKRVQAQLQQQTVNEQTVNEQTLLEQFWASVEGKKKSLTQLERYKAKQSPDYITKLISIGGGSAMGVTCEQYARFRFKVLKKRDKGRTETGYDHIITVNDNTVFVEQKSSGHWGEHDYKWQHVEEKHKWNMLLLCGIDYTDVLFWGMDRHTFQMLCEEGVITNQGNKSKDSSEGRWFNYSDVKDNLIPIRTDEELLKFAEKCSKIQESKPE